MLNTQQSRIGINSVNTAELGDTIGGVRRRLYELKSGQGADLDSDPTAAFQIVDKVINQVASMRGRLGAFQRTTLDSNVASLNDALTNITEAESKIRDADFAEETARLTRAQILVQSGTSVLKIANQNPQNVLSLLG
ncbi:MAG: B-type flagellin [Planctomycetota bacterium]